MRRIILITVFLSSIAAPVMAQKATIEALNAKWTELFSKGDFDGVTKLYTVNAVTLAPGSPMVKGRQAIGAMLKTISQQVSNLKLTTIDVKRLGPSAIREIGTYSMMTKGASPKEETGKYVVVWERSQGRWMLATDIWNEGK
jgi:uncharacterized protein (TIGR02246 family)